MVSAAHLRFSVFRTKIMIMIFSEKNIFMTPPRLCMNWAEQLTWTRNHPNSRLWTIWTIRTKNIEVITIQTFSQLIKKIKSKRMFLKRKDLEAIFLSSTKKTNLLQTFRRCTKLTVLSEKIKVPFKMITVGFLRLWARKIKFRFKNKVYISKSTRLREI